MVWLLGLRRPPPVGAPIELLETQVTNASSVRAPAALHSNATRSAVVARDAVPCVLALDPTWRWALAQHRTPFSQPGHIRQRAVGPRWPEEPLSQLSWACPRHRWRSRTDICDQAGGRPSLSVEIQGRRAAARRLPSQRAASHRRGRGTTRLVADACRRCRAEEDRCPVFVSRAASADRYDSTCYRVTRCETGHSCCRAAHWRTACVSCVVRLHTTAEWESLRSKARLDRACSSPN